jgi:osmotically-inducible protein OsmY
MVTTTDTQICRQVEERLVTDKRTRDAVIDVSCLAGVVTLSGDVPKAAVKEAAEELARTVGGVHNVANELRVH